MTDLTELNKLEDYLKSRGYSYERNDEHPRFGKRAGMFHQLVVYADGERSWDAICHWGSYGFEEGLLEIMGDIVRDDEDQVVGYLTADDVIGRLEQDEQRDKRSNR